MYVVIMGGGAGKRFWPKSRESNPKQFLKIAGNESMLRETFSRCLCVTSKDKIFVVTHEKFTDKVKMDLPELNINNIIQEPQARNTAPCIALSTFYIKKFFGNENILFMPADHIVSPVNEFEKTVKYADKRVNETKGAVIFGIKPRYPETGYGYIKRGDEKSKSDKGIIFEVDKFVEKPDKQKAEKYIEQGGFFWNSGMFLFNQERLINSFKEHLSGIYDSFHNADFGEKENFSPAKIASFYSGLDKISIDTGLIEKESELEMIECSFKWSDVGNWKALEEIWNKDDSGNAVKGLFYSKDSKGVLASTQNKLLVTMGVEDLVIIESDDALFVCKKSHIDRMKEMLEEMEKADLSKYI